MCLCVGRRNNFSTRLAKFSPQQTAASISSDDLQSTYSITHWLLANLTVASGESLVKSKVRPYSRAKAKRTFTKARRANNAALTGMLEVKLPRKSHLQHMLTDYMLKCPCQRLKIIPFC